MSQEPVSPEVTSDDKLLAALGYPIALIALIMLLLQDKRARPFIKFHAVQSLVLNIAFYVVATVLSVVTLGFGSMIIPLIWLAFLYCAFLAYQGRMFVVPFITDFIRRQNWV